ncbi:uncharacterized protein LOC128730166 [Anopheles nili]|uniref:uncharacterized protein LOC128730166 n=1 Tax=Anopheles nili TaxID=185578 RepID=UPI00237AA05A|nr:uncharacterized protein LOC128730166 [Anopheles nili]
MKSILAIVLAGVLFGAAVSEQQVVTVQGRPRPELQSKESSIDSRSNESDESTNNEENPCEGLLIGILQHPSSCYKYITCFKEVATEETCPIDMIFDLDEITCVPGNQRTCRKNGDEVPLPGDMCRGIILGTRLHPEDCGKYVSCLLGRARERSCRRGFVFSERLYVCLPGDVNSCEVTLRPTTTTTTAAPDSSIPSDFCRKNNVAFGSLPHPQSCTRFVSCTLWIPLERRCGPFQVFSERLSSCVLGNVNTCQPIIGREAE